MCDSAVTMTKREEADLYLFSFLFEFSFSARVGGYEGPAVTIVA